MRIQYLNVPGILSAGFLLACSGANPASLSQSTDAGEVITADARIPDAQDLPCGPGTVPGDGGLCVIQMVLDASLPADVQVLADAEATPDVLVVPDTSQASDGWTAPDTSQYSDGSLVPDAVADALPDVVSDILLEDATIADAAVLADAGPDSQVVSDATLDALLPDAAPPPEEPVWPRLAPGPCVVQVRVTRNPADDFDLVFQYDEHENVVGIDKTLINRNMFVYQSTYTNTYEGDVLVQVASEAPFDPSFSAFEPAQTHALSYYDDTGLLETLSVTYDGRIGGYELYYAYDDNGNKIMEEKTETPNGRNMYTWLYLYDEVGRLLRYEEQREGDLLRWDTYTYTEDGLSGRVAQTEYTQTPDGDIVETVYAYENLLFDENGRLIEKALEQHGSEAYLNTYTYDEGGNLLTDVRWSRTGEIDEVFTTTDYDYSCWIPQAQ